MIHASSRNAEHPGGATRVTLVDDEPFVAEFLFQAATGWGYQCQVAHTAESALDLLQANPTPIVVTDVRMPGRGGLWLVEEVKRRWPDAGIIVITAGDDREAVDKCLQAGAQHYFLKPVHLVEFQHAIETVSRNYRLQAENRRYREHLEETVARRTRQVRRTFLSGIESLVLTLEAKDANTCGHSHRVRNMAVALARQIGLMRSEIKQLALAAKLHDIGKIGLPEAILNKEGKLSPEEMAVVRQHPAMGEHILQPIIRNRVVLAAIRGHHERYDGTGYPDGLKGDEICLITRILTIADCFDAMTSNRSYRNAMTAEQALNLIEAQAGTHFDGELVTPFRSMLMSGCLT